LQEPSLAAQKGGAKQAPIFEVDPFWPKPLPNHWVQGSTIGLSVDAQDHVWVIHRPSSVEENFKAADANPPIGICCKVAPEVLEFDQEGTLVNHWGGPPRDTNGRRTITGLRSITKGMSGSAETATRIRRF
jgi:hypothetical protein